MASILRQGIAVSAARYVEQDIMLLTPVVLVRTIGPTAFGEYWLFWLLVTTVALLFPFDLPRKLKSKAYLLLASRDGQGGASAERRESALHRDFARTRGHCSTGAL